MGASHAFERALDLAGGTASSAGSLVPSPQRRFSRHPERPAAEQPESLVRPPSRGTALLPPLRQLGRRLVVLISLFLILFPALIASWPVIAPSTAFALGFTNPNAPLTTPSWLATSSQPGKQPNLNKSAASPNNTIPSHTPPHQWQVPMRPAKLTLTNAAQHFVSSDGQLLVDVPAGSLDATQLTQQHGSISLIVTQVKPGSGGGSSGQVAFGTYEFQFFDASGKALSGVHLLHPLTIHFHLRQDQAALVAKGQEVYALWNAVQGATNAPVIPTVSPATTQAPSMQTAVEPQPLSTQPSTLLTAQGDQSGLDWSVQSSFSTPPSSTSRTAQTNVVQPAVQASSVAFGTSAPQATWGTPTDVQVGLNSGGLNYSYPLSVPGGPGGLQPSLALNYSSGSVDENHGWQSASPWVGQGWSLDLGSVSWSQENVTPNGSPTLENVWHISDPSGIGGQLIPPDQTYTTAFPVVPSVSSWPNPAPIWHTAPESHAKVQEILFGGYPCWRVYLPNGIMEEFGCTDPAREAYPDANGKMVAYSWKLDMMVDAYGNQVHINYQRIYPANKGQVRDAAISDIEYDDPTCHSTTTMCTTWNPQVKIVFDANQTVAHLLNGGCGNGTAGQFRCDDPIDLSGSGGLPQPEVMSAYVLNDVQVQVQGNLLHEYVFSYNQGGPSTQTDPNTGKSESVAGYLILGKIQEEGTNGTSLNAPVVSMQYNQGWEHYSDLFSYSANNGTVCSPYGSAPRDGSASGPCFLWSQSMSAYYITNLDNGRGWNESITYNEAHGNTWGTDNGTNFNNAFQCSSSQTSTNICGTADDKNWSRLVVASRTATSNGVSSTWHYNYFLTTVNAAIPGHAVSSRTCHGACESYDWGNQNDGDVADYWNGAFQSFQQVQVTLPDNSSQTNTYGSTNGWGLFSSSITCVSSPCTNAPYNASNGPVLAGKQQQEQDFNSSGALMKQTNWTWATNCSPQGVPGTQHALGGSTDPGGSFLFSHLDHNNPIIDCDPRATQMDSYTTDGVTNNITDARVVHTTTAYTFDGNTCGAQNYDYGNLSKQDVTANDVGGAHTVSFTLFCPNDNISGSIYLTNLPAMTQTLNATGTIFGCAQTYYGGSSNAISAPSQPDVTRTDAYTGYSGGCVGNVLTTLHGYDASGTAITGTDPDGHLGCTNSSQQFTACATYDSFGTHLLTATNAKNQVTTYEYDQDAPQAGFGQWLMSETDPNGQTTTYQYDALGRLTGVIRPGDSASSPTVAYAYNNTCTAGSTKPCIEMDTTTRFTVGGPTTTMKTWYDGWGRQIETQTPGPNLFSHVPAIPSELINYSIYDTMGNATTKSLPYAVAATSGLGFVAPDLNQPRNVTGYDTLGRTLGTVSYSNASTIVQSSTSSYTIAQGVPTLSGESSNAYEQKITLDAYNHQSISYTDGLGRTRYSQIFSGTTSPYSVVRTVGTTYDTVGNTLSVQTYDSTGTVQATYSATYDGLKRLQGFNDSDLGSCSNTPMPGDCSGTTDNAWKYTYDADGNQLSLTDPRNQSTYTTYDVLDRPLCSALTAADASSCGGSTNKVFFYDSYTNAGTPGATFPSTCTAPSGSYASDPIGRKTAELFVGTSGAGNGSRCYGYDQRGQTDQSGLSVATPDAGTLTQTVNMTYNDGGQVSSLVYPDGETLTSTYDLNGRLHTIYFGTPSSPDPVSFLVGQMTYANDGQTAGMAIGGSGAKGSVPTPIFSTTTTYDGIERPLSNSVKEAGQTLWSQARTYDNAGNVLALSTVVPTQSGGTLTENESFCYDALNRLVWAGNSGTPTGGDHCMAPPTGTTLPAYSQAYTYDNLDRTTSGSAGSYTYADASQVHAVTSVGSVPNPYAAYDAMGNMLCRNVDPTTAHTCGGSTPTGALMSYDNQGQLASWAAPSGVVGSAHYLYDNQGNRVLTNASSASSTTDTVYFDGYTETLLTGGTTTTTKYYSANGARLAVRVGSAPLNYLVGDPLGSNTVALNSTGQVIALQHYSPYGTVDYSWGTMPTSFNYAGERLDSQTGLLYDNFRYYDALTGRYVRSDNVQDNSNGMDPYAYVGDNPETRNDPSGHCWPICAITALVGAAVGFTVGVVAQAQTGNWSAGAWARTAADTALGAGDGFLLGSGIGTVAGAAAIGTLIGGTGGAISSQIGHKSLGQGLQDTIESATIGGITNVIASGLGSASVTLMGRTASSLGGSFVRMAVQGGIQAEASAIGNGAQQELSIMSGEQQGGWNWTSFAEATAVSGVTGAISQGVGDFIGANRTPVASLGRAATKALNTETSNLIADTQNIVTGVSQAMGSLFNW